MNVTGYPFPLGPFLNRPTIRTELVKGSIWGYEQAQSLGGSNVTANIRMTVVKLQTGGLWVHAPIAPTREQAGGLAGRAADWHAGQTDPVALSACSCHLVVWGCLLCLSSGGLAQLAPLSAACLH